MRKLVYKIGLQSFNPRPPRGGRLNILRRSLSFVVISIHALREEGDVEQYALDGVARGISIHALRGEGDQTLFRRESSSNHFNIRHYENL